MICPENNKDGGGVVRILIDAGYPKLTQESIITGNPSRNRYGWMNNGATKKRMVNALQEAFSERTIDITDEVIIEEAKHLIFKSGQSARGWNVMAAKKGQRRRPGSLPVGYYDDTIFALGGALLLESCLDAPKTPKMLESVEKMQRHREMERKQHDRYDENAWLEYG